MKRVRYHRTDVFGAPVPGEVTKKRYKWTCSCGTESSWFDRHRDAVIDGDEHSSAMAGDWQDEGWGDDEPIIE